MIQMLRIQNVDMNNKKSEKNKENDPDAAKSKRKQEQQKFRKSHREKDLKTARKKQAQAKRKYRKDEYDMKRAYKNLCKNIQQYPEYICTCCSRMLYKRSVVAFNKATFKRTSENLLNQCVANCRSAKNKEWLCRTCLHYKNVISYPHSQMQTI